MTETLFDIDTGPTLWPDRPRVLMSYAYAKNMTGDDFAALSHADVVIDSGAFTAHSSGKAIDHDAYLGWLVDHASACRFAFALDVIGDHEASTRNWLSGQDRIGDAVQLVPTWHIGTGFDVLEDYCSRTDYVAVGGAVAHYRDQRSLWKLSRRAHDIAADHGTRLHGLGMTGRRIMRNLPWSSVDSSSWAITARLPFLYLANEPGRLVSLTLGRPLNAKQRDLITTYGGDPDGMDVEGWALASVAGDHLALARKTWAVRASARAYMHAEAAKPRPPKGLGTDFRIYLAANPRDTHHLTHAHQAGDPYDDRPSTPETTLKEVIVMTTPRPTAIVVCSGGMDSTTLVAGYHATHDVTVLSVDYGQRHRRELDAAADVAAHYGLEHVIVDATGIGDVLTGSALTDNIDVPEGHYTADTMKATVVPNRNAILANIAVGVAVARGADVVALGVHAGDHAVYPDCTPDFIDALDAMVQAANGERAPKIEAPFVNMSKAAIADIAATLDAPLGLSWSCYKGGDIHCGRCGTCVERAEAFHIAGLSDPTEYDDPTYWREATA